MTLREALEYAREHGGYVTRGTPPDWSEYLPQHFWRDGVLYWTAGMTTGGEMPQGLGDRRLERSLGLEGFGVYSKWGDQEPVR